MKKLAIQSLRWVVVLPGGIIASCLAYCVTYYTQLLFADVNSWYATHILPVESSFISGVAWIFASAWCAPNYRKQTALIVFVLSCIFVGYGIFFFFIHGKYLDMSMNIGAVIGSVIGLLYANMELSDNQTI